MLVEISYNNFGFRKSTNNVRFGAGSVSVKQFAKKIRKPPRTRIIPEVKPPVAENGIKEQPSSDIVELQGKKRRSNKGVPTNGQLRGISEELSKEFSKREKAVIKIMLDGKGKENWDTIGKKLNEKIEKKAKDEKTLASRARLVYHSAMTKLYAHNKAEDNKEFLWYFGKIENLKENEFLQRLKSLRNEIANENIGLCITYANKFAKKNNLQNSMVDALISRAYMGLNRAIEKYDARNGELSTYANCWMYQSCNRFLTETVSQWRHLPQYKSDEIRMVLNTKALAEASKERVIDYTRMPPELISKIAKETKLPEKKVEEIIRVYNSVAIKKEEVVKNISRRGTSCFCSEEAADAALLKIQTALEQLSPTEREIIIQRFGLEDGVEKSHKDIYTALNLSNWKYTNKLTSALDKLSDLLGDLF